MIPLGVLASARVAAAGGGPAVTLLGLYASGESVAAPSGGSVVLCFGRGAGTTSTLSDVLVGAVSATVAADRAIGRRGGSSIQYAASPGTFTLTYTGGYNCHVYHVDRTIAHSGVWAASPTAADGLWTATLSPASSAGQLAMVAVGVSSSGGTSTLDSPLTITLARPANGNMHSGWGLVPSAGYNPSGDIDPPQTIAAYTAVCAATFTLT